MLRGITRVNMIRRHRRLEPSLLLRRRRPRGRDIRTEAADAENLRRVSNLRIGRFRLRCRLRLCRLRRRLVGSLGIVTRYDTDIRST